MEERIKVLVTGADGQLGLSLQKLAATYPSIWFDFQNKSTLDISDLEAVQKAFKTGQYRYCINTAAFTDVEEAERNPQKAFEVNVKGVRHLAMACKAYDVILLHISTDYVFDGENQDGYTVDDIPNPINVYGKSKWEGEKIIQSLLTRYFIVRTSWLYSEIGRNFYTKIREKIKQGETLYVTDAQKGCPTHASHLAYFLIQIVEKGTTAFGIHHFTDKEVMTHFEFAARIIKETGMTDTAELVCAHNYRSFIRRPKNCILLNSSI